MTKDILKPALIIANGARCSETLLKRLLDESSIVIVLDAAISRVLELNIKVDVLLGDFDRHFDANYYKNSQNGLKIVHTPDQSKTDLEKAFEYLVEQNFTKVNVVWATGKRADHTITNITSIAKFRNKLKIILFDDYSKIFLLPKKFEQWYAKKTIISLIPIGLVEGIKTKNLFYPLNNDSLIIGYKTGSSNHVISDGIVCIEHTAGDLLLMECWD